MKKKGYHISHYRYQTHTHTIKNQHSTGHFFLTFIYSAHTYATRGAGLFGRPAQPCAARRPFRSPPSRARRLWHPSYTRPHGSAASLHPNGTVLMTRRHLEPPAASAASLHHLAPPRCAGASSCLLHRCIVCARGRTTLESEHASARPEAGIHTTRGRGIKPK